MIEKLLANEVQQFILDNEHTDPFELSLKHKSLFGLPTQVIADQITARKKAKSKLPEWYHTKGVIYPPLLSMEQCSSEKTAIHKSKTISGSSLIDLTGGTGVDTFYLSKVFKKVTYVERNEELCEIARHNFNVLGAANITVVHADSEEFIKSYDKKADAIFIDPARRDDSNKKVFMWSDCEPNIIGLLSKLLGVANQVLIKASPLLDLSAGSKDLHHVSATHVVAVKNECKELLYLLDKNSQTKTIKTSNYSSENNVESFDFSVEEEQSANANYAAPQALLYEPNSSVLKSGAFKILCDRFGLSKLHLNSHLYTSQKFVANFPGRSFFIKQVVRYNKKELLKLLPDKKANITVRNFPEDVAAIRKKTGIKAGGNIYLFATTTTGDQKVIIVCEKAR
ncbi:MAG: RsmD family RNA methyltransferase [Fulvivirga sp.]